jgi:glycine cleavage system H lipoate-binding protein
MRCPFLREAQVKSCCASPFKKMIVRTVDRASYERCSSNEWISCPASKQHHEDRPAVDHCPFLQESLVQYCSGIPVLKYVPYSDAPLSRCSNDSHLYCEVFLSMVNPGTQLADHHVPPCSVSQNKGVCYSKNHMWLDVHEDESCHVGIDAFLAKFLGNVERLSYVTTKSVCSPTAVITARGVDLESVFPVRIQVTGVNTYLRARPSSLVSHPYTLGWLFEGIVPKDPSEGSIHSTDNGMIKSGQARRWLGQESRRLTDYVHNELLLNRNREFATMMDGGSWSEDLIIHLTREEILQVWNEFFSTSAGLRPA